MSKLILVGRIAGAFGVRGELRISTYTEQPMALAKFKKLLREDGSPALTLTSARPAKDGVVARCPEINDKDAADALRGVRLYVTRDALPKPVDEDEFYQTDLLGLKADTPEGETLGSIKAVLNVGAGDILEIDPGAGRATRYIPFTRAAVPEVRIGEGRVIVIPPVEIGEPEPNVDQDQGSPE
jgi:16S rRNA processing protein RimM